MGQSHSVVNIKNYMANFILWNIGGEGAIIMFDVTVQQTYDYVPWWHQKIQQFV